MNHTIVISKPKNTRTTYISHGTRTPEGGYFGTADAGWSQRRAIQYEVGRLPKGVSYDVKVNGKLTQSGVS